MNRGKAMLSALLVSALLLSGCSIGHPNDYTLPGGVATGSDGYDVVGYFDTVDNLVPNSRVLYNEVPVGTVRTITAQDCRTTQRPASCGSARGWRAKVTISLRKSVALPRNVGMKIGQKSLLGAEFVEVNKPGQPQGRLASGDIIGSTGSYPTTEDVLSAVSLLLNNGGLAQLDTITTEINAALGGREGDARDLITQLNVFATALNTRRSAVITALSAANKLSSTLRAQTTTINAALDKIGPGLQALNNQRDLLTSAIGKLGRFGKVATQVLNASHAALVANLNNIKPVLAGLNASGDSLPKVLNELTFPFPLENVQRLAQGDFVNFFITVDATGTSLLGTVGPGSAPTPIVKSTSAKQNAGRTTAPPSNGSAATTAPKSGSTPAATSSVATPTSTPTCPLLTHLLGGC